MSPTATQVVAKNTTLRNLVETQITEIFEFSQMVRDDHTYLNDFLVRFDAVASLYNEFKEYHKIILPNITKEEDIVVHETVRKQVDKMYFSIQVIHKDILAANSNSNLSRSDTPAASEKSSNLKLPRISLPVFDGTKLSEWPTFLDLFNSLIHNNDSLSSIERFHYLITSLSKEPLSLVKAIPMTNGNYLIAYNALLKRYQNKRLLATNYWNILLNYSPLTSDSQNSLRHLCDTFSENLSALKALEFAVDSWDFPLFNLLLSKLDSVTRKQFELSYSQEELPSFKNLYDFVFERARALETFYTRVDQRNPPREVKQPKPKFTQQATSSFVANASYSAATPCCPVCRAEHKANRCPLFLSKSPMERFQLAKDNKMCLNCLSKGHSLSRCTSGACRSCGQRHHTLLHFGNSSQTSQSPLQQPNSRGTAVTHQSASLTDSTPEQPNPSALTSTIENTATVLLSTALVEILDVWGNFQTIKVLLDSGSQANFISQPCLRRLGLKTSSQVIPIQGLNSSSNVVSSGITTCIVKPRGQPEPQLRIQALVLDRICNEMPSIPIDIQGWSHIVNLKLADPSFNRPSNIDMLLGAEFFPLILTPGLLSSSPEKPLALNTIFGWVLMGKVSTQQPLPLNSFHASVELPLQHVLQRFWELEQIPTRSLMAPEDELVEKAYQTQHYRDSSGRYVVPLLLKSEQLTFVDSYSVALRRFLILERRFAHNSTLRDSYNSFMQDYLDSNHMNLLKLSQEEIHRPDTFYIPHHAVFKTDNISTKIRVVFDASSTDLEGNSLNKSVFVGPKLQTDITNILLRFRLHSVVFTADARQMYRQVLVRPEERKYQRILWRFSPSDPVQIFQLNTVTYGISSSPFLAIRTMLQLASDEKSQFPLASKVLASDTYIDDLVTGCSSLDEAKILKNQIISILAHAKIELRKWSSNNSSFLEDVPTEHCQTQSLSFDNNSSTVKILGLQWHSASDFFSYEVSPWDRPCTKRHILSELARIFDPLGFLAPLTFLAKHLIQQLWTCGADWDDTPPLDIIKQWNRYKLELPLLSSLQIPRRLIVDNLASCQLLGFCDASSIGYSSIVYFRTVDIEDQIKIFLVCAKSKVAPLKSVSIPRLELCAAVLLSDLISFVVTVFDGLITFDRILAFSDSSVTLACIRSSPHRWKPFVSNRVAHIQETLPPSYWHHIQSSNNPADCASRGLFPLELVNFTLWWHGPTWMQNPVDQWPAFTLPSENTSSELSDVSQEKRTTALAATIPQHFLIVLLARYSSITKVQHILAYCIRFLHNLRNSQSKMVGNLTVDELHRSLSLIIKQVQHSVFAEEIRKLVNGTSCSKQLRKLNPFLDRQGILRVGGRIRHSDLDFEAKHPALLPGNHRFTDLIVEDTHRRFLHPGAQTLHFLLRQNFWILAARRNIRRIIGKCFRCFRTKPSSSPPLMGDLPSFRITQVKPFMHVGVDYAGPFKITMGKYRGAKTTKSYLCLFVCMATKALHLELVSDLTSEACVAALRRFLARRGRCAYIYSDCGRNFIGANKELTSLFQLAASDESISWRFNAPSAPHFGGLWEAGIKSVKTHLFRVIGDQILTYEELQTVLIQIEALLNSRPLSELSSDPNDLSPLTPGHFLTLAPLTVVPDPDMSHLKTNRLGRWQLLQRMHAEFWRRWHCEYLHTLQQRAKWNINVPNLSPGTLVLIREDTSPPMQWRLGRITDLIVGKDGVSRIANVRTASGIIKRPLIKLCPLPTLE